jgi:hypothetical protein
MSEVADRAPALVRGILMAWLSAVWMVLEASITVGAGVLARSVALEELPSVRRTDPGSSREMTHLSRISIS